MCYIPKSIEKYPNISILVKVKELQRCQEAGALSSGINTRRLIKLSGEDFIVIYYQIKFS